MLPDRWNPRVWLRNWLAKETKAERASAEALASWKDDLITRIHSDVLAAVDAPVKPKATDEIRTSNETRGARATVIPGGRFHLVLDKDARVRGGVQLLDGGPGLALLADIHSITPKEDSVGPESSQFASARPSA